MFHHLYRIEIPEGTISINQYFVDHPEMVLGKHSLQGSMYGDNEYTVLPGSEPIADGLARVTELLPADIFGRAPASEAQVDAGAREAATKAQREGTLVEKDGKVFLIENGFLTAPNWSEPKKKQAKDYLGVKRATLELIDAMGRIDDDAEVAKFRAKLNKVYDAYVKKHGTINQKGNKFLEDDLEFPTVAALELVTMVPVEKVRLSGANKGQKYTVMEPSVQKADIFTKRTVFPFREPTKADSLEDAIKISRVYRTGINVEFVAELLGTTPGVAKDQIIERRAAFENPESGLLEPRDLYLSGNVKEKLRIATAAAKSNPAYAVNVEALEAVQPAALPIDAIRVRLGSYWLPSGIVQRFLGYLGVRHPRVERTRVEGAEGSTQWDVNGVLSADTQKWGMDGASVMDLVNDSLNLKRTVVYDEVATDDGKTKRVKNPQESLAAQEKQREIQDEFRKWVLRDEAASREIETLYNEKFNGHVARKFEVPDIVHYPGAAHTVTLRENQKVGVARALQESTLLAHGVGSGKTYLQITLAMEMRRLGTAKKPWIVVQGSTLSQFAASFKQLYPGARILAPTEGQRKAVNRQRLLAQIASGDWDAIITPHGFFNSISIDPDNEARFIQEQIAEYEDMLMSDFDTRGRSERELERDPTVKAIRRKIKAMETRLQKLANTRRDANIFFESLGVDALIIDEAHAYKRGDFYTKMDNVKGLDRDSSQRSMQMLMKARHVQEKTGGKNVIMATGTPISNTLTEMWTMFRYIRPDLLDAFGVEQFDDFASTFADTSISQEETATGDYKDVERFNVYVNGPELLTMWRTGADVVITEDLDYIKGLPKLMGGKVQEVAVERSEELGNYIRALKAERDAWDNLSGKEKREQSHVPLVIFGRAKKAAIDLRLIDSGMPDTPNSKANTTVANLYQRWQDNHDTKATQIVFCDIFQSSDKAFNLFQDIKNKLVARGVPAEEIAIIHDFKTDDARAKMFDKVKAGEIRIVMGTTEKLGTGVNIQDRLLTAHHLDAPPRPMDFEQRNGRIRRPGNMHPEVEILVYGTKNTLDSVTFQQLISKQKFINQVLRGEMQGRSFENPFDEVQATFADMMAAFSGNPLAKEKMQLQSELRKLTMLKSAHDDRIYGMRGDIRGRERSIQRRKEELVTAEKAAAFVAEKFADGIPDRKELNKRVQDWIDKVRPQIVAKVKPAKTYEQWRALVSDKMNMSTEFDIGHGIKVTVTAVPVYEMGPDMVHIAERDIRTEFSLSGPHEIKSFITSFTGGSGLMTRITNFLESVQGKPDTLKAQIKDHEENIAALKVELEKPFERQTELDAAQARYEEVEAELANALNEDLEAGRAEVSEEEDGPQYQIKAFYSAVERAIVAMPFKTIPAQDLLNRIGKIPGVKAEELEDLGLHDWLTGLGNAKVTKEQVLEFVRQGGPQIEEVTKGSTKDKSNALEAAYSLAINQLMEVDAYDDRAMRIMDAWLADPNQDNTLDAEELFIDNDLEWESVFGGTVADAWSGGATKFSQYTLPGGGNYREVLLTLPSKRLYGKEAIDRLDQLAAMEKRSPREDQELSDLKHYNINGVYPEVGGYRSPHWEEPNILAHVRLNDRTGPNGEKVLFIEEIQSDWHQAGRKDGYDSPAAERKKLERLQALSVKFDRGEATKEEQSELEQLTRDRSNRDLKRGVPNAPFKKSWALLAFKRVLRMAAEQGYDSVAWTPGEVQAERYDLSKQVESIGYQPRGDLFNVTVWDKNGRIVYGNQSATAHELENAVGKELAQKMVDGVGRKEGSITYLEDLDLKVGGEGMRGFYDRILTAEVNKYVKKWGVKVAQETVATPSDNTAARMGDLRAAGYENHPVQILTDLTGKSEFTYTVEVMNPDGEVVKEFPVHSREEADAIAVRELDALLGRGQTTAWTLPLTDAMREDIMQGQPLYEQGGAAQPSLVDLREAFPWADSIEEDGAGRTVVTKGKVSFSVTQVERITPNEVAFKIKYGRKPGAHDQIAGEYKDGEIRLSRVADKWTVQHEYVHFLEDMGLLNKMETAILDAAVKKAEKGGALKFDPAPGGVRLAPSELRAYYVQHELAAREFTRQTPVGRILQKIADLVDSFVNLFTRTARGIVRDVESGRPMARNTSALDPAEAVQYSVAPTVQATSKARSFVKNVLARPEQLDRLNFIHTQLDKKIKLPAFGKVFDRIHAMAGTAAQGAASAAALARDILPRSDAGFVDSLKDMAQVQRTIRVDGKDYPYTQADYAPVSDVLSAGTLSGKDPSPYSGRVFTKDELLGGVEVHGRKFKLTMAQYGLYEQARDAINKSVWDMAVSEAWKKIKNLVDPDYWMAFEQNPAGADVVMDSLLMAELAKTDAEMQQIEAEALAYAGVKDMVAFEKHVKRVGKYVAKMRKLARDMKKAESDPDSDILIAKLEDKADRLESEFGMSLDDAIEELKTLRGFAKKRREAIKRAGNIAEIHDQILGPDGILPSAQQLIEAGYAPLMRFGRYVVRITNDEGQQMAVFRYDSSTEANFAREKLARDFGGVPGVNVGAVTYQNDKQWELYKDVNPESVLLFAKKAGFGTDAALQEVYREMTSQRSALKRLIRRTGIHGYSNDLQRGLATFLTSNSKRMAQNYHSSAVMDLIQSMPDDDVQAEAIDLWNFHNDAGDAGSGFRSFAAVWYLLGSMMSAVWNGTQAWTSSMPELVKHGSTATGAAGKLMQGYATRLVFGDKYLTEEEKHAIARARKDGTIDAAEVHHLYAMAMRRGVAKIFGSGKTAQSVSAFLRLWGMPFSWFEVLNRDVTFLAAYRLANEQGRGDAYAFAKNVVDVTQGIYKKHNRPNFARSGVGGAVLTFMQYKVMTLEQIVRNTKGDANAKKAAALQLLMLMVMGGWKALPGMSDAADLLDIIMQTLFGRAWLTGPQVKQALKSGSQDVLEKVVSEEAAKMLSGVFAEFMNTGISGLPGAPLDVSGRAQFGNLIPGIKLFKPSTKYRDSEVFELFGVPGGMLDTLVQAGAHALEDKDPVRALKALAPNAIQAAGKGIDIASSGQITNSRGAVITEGDMVDAVLQFFGGQPRSKAKESNRLREVNEVQHLVQKREAAFLQEYVRIVNEIENPVEKTKAKLALSKKISQWNKDNPDWKIVLSAAQKSRAVRDSRRTVGEQTKRRMNRMWRKNLKADE